MEIPDGPLQYKSPHDPHPLSERERKLLAFFASGSTGYNTGMEHTIAGPANTLCSYPVRFIGRSAPSASAIGASELLITDDSGTYITRVRNKKSVDPNKGALTLEEAAEELWDTVLKISDSRIDLPRNPPHYSAHNIWNGNVAGSTVYIPIVNLTEILLNFLLIYMGSGFTPWDSTRGTFAGDFEKLGEEGVLDLNKRFSIQEFEQYIVACGAAEAAIMSNNAVLAMQAMGLGGWLFTGIDPTSLLGGREGVPGAGFRFTPRDQYRAPLCVGLEDVIEGYTPEWYGDSPRAAVEAFLDRKYGPSGTYSGEYTSPWKDKSTVQHKDAPAPGLREALIKVAEYLYDAYGTFPGTIPAVYARIYAQAHHIDSAFYDTFYEHDVLLPTHRMHDNEWHSEEKEIN